MPPNSTADWPRRGRVVRRHGRPWRSGLGLVLVAAVSSLASPALARQVDTYHYTFEQVWGSAIRMVRVDMDCPIVARDETIGFLHIAYRARGRGHPGSIELIKSERDGRPDIQVVVQIRSMPSYIERMVLDRLERKLDQDFGAPIVAPRRPATPPDRDREDPDDDDEGGGDQGGEGAEHAGGGDRAVSPSLQLPRSARRRRDY